MAWFLRTKPEPEPEADFDPGPASMEEIYLGEDLNKALRAAMAKARDTGNGMGLPVSVVDEAIKRRWPLWRRIQPLWRQGRLWFPWSGRRNLTRQDGVRLQQYYLLPDKMAIGVKVANRPRAYQAISIRDFVTRITLDSSNRSADLKALIAAVEDLGL